MERAIEVGIRSIATVTFIGWFRIMASVAMSPGRQNSYSQDAGINHI
jgi:hypothetical protein